MTPPTYALRTVGAWPTIVCLLCDAVSASPGDIHNRYCARCHLFHDAIAEGRRLLAFGGAHECDEWRSSRGACALCGQAVGPASAPAWPDDADAPPVLANPPRAWTPIVAGDRVRVTRGGAVLPGVVVRVIGRSFVVECPGPLFLLFNASTAGDVVRDDDAGQEAR